MHKRRVDQFFRHLGCVSKIRNGKMKHRMILDSNRPGITKTAQLPVGANLSMVSDVVFDMLELLPDLRSDEVLWLIVMDVINAFVLVPLDPLQRRFFVARYRRLLLLWLRTAQGSNGAPLTSAILFGLCTRCSMNTIGDAEEPRRHQANGSGH